MVWCPIVSAVLVPVKRGRRRSIHLASVTCFPTWQAHRETYLMCDVKVKGIKHGRLYMIQKGNHDWQFQGCNLVS